MLTKHRKPACLALHRCVPHVRGTDWHDKIQSVVPLEYGELPCVLGDWRRHSCIAPLQLRFEGRIQLEFRPRTGKELCDPTQVIQMLGANECNFQCLFGTFAIIECLNSGEP